MEKISSVMITRPIVFFCMPEVGHLHVLRNVIERTVANRRPTYVLAGKHAKHGKFQIDQISWADPVIDGIALGPAFTPRISTNGMKIQFSKPNVHPPCQ